ncbi:MAG: hypothetical protein IKR56_02185 [Lachnospiraceae bacterium]|nr:hypothetical protein [Lachnospiraceae bacterium]
MKRFLLKCALFFGIICLIFLPVAYIIDPYNVFHATHPIDRGVEPDKAYLKPLNVIRKPGDYDSLLFGSSRVGFFDVSRMNDGRYYDMMSSEAVPAEHLITLKALINRGFVPKNVIVGVDDISYFVDPAPHDQVLFRKMYPWDGSLPDKLGFFIKFMDPITIYDSLETMREYNKVDEHRYDRLLTTGTEPLDIVPNFDTEKNLEPYWAAYYMPRSESLEDIRQLKELCDEHGIKLTIFTNPVFGHTYAKDIDNGYLVFLEELAGVVDYYNFSGFNDVTLDTKYYYENSHYSKETSDLIIDRIFYDKVDERLLSQGFGYYVTKDNVDEFMDILNDQVVNFDLPVNTYSDTLNRDPNEHTED